jgi:hypothetical protein
MRLKGAAKRLLLRLAGGLLKPKPNPLKTLALRGKKSGVPTVDYGAIQRISASTFVLTLLMKARYPGKK